MHSTPIRSYAPRDLLQLLEVWEQGSRVGHSFLPDDFLEAERDMIRDVYLPRVETWVYEEGGRVVGFISLIENEIGALFIHPSYHRRGIGRALMELAMGLHPVLEVEVFERNEAAVAFYSQCGFVRMSDYRHPGTGFVLLRMRRAPQE